MRLRPLVGLALIVTGAGGGGLFAGDEPEVAVTLALEDQANDIWSGLTGAMDDRRVTRLGRTSEACAADALDQAGRSAERLQASRLALRTLKLTVRLPRILLEKARTTSPAAAADLFGHYARSSGEDDFVARAAPRPARATGESADRDAALRALYRQLARAQSDQSLHPVLDVACGAGLVLYDLRALPDRPGRLYLHMLVEGGCACRGLPSGGARPQRFRVLGEAELEPGARSAEAGGVTLRWRVKEPRYAVLASCRACEGGRDEAPATAAATGPCGQPCAPLQDSLSGWRHEQARIEADVSALTGKTSALQGDLGKQRQDLAAAEASPRKPRPALDRIEALRRQVAGTQAELAKVTGLAADAKKHLGEVKGAVDDAQGAGQRCQAQCEARQQPQQQTAQAGGAQGAAAAGGGGLGTGTLIVGGAAVAAGATAAVVVAGRDQLPAGIVGTWEGTRVINNGPRFDNCTRVYDEVWNIQQMGQNLVADAEAIGRGCGGPTCPQNCQIFPFPWHMLGTVEGSVYRIVVFGGTSCILSLRISGDMLGGSMSPCNEADGMTQDVALRRRRN